MRLLKKKSLGPWLISSLVTLGLLLVVSIGTSWWALRRSEIDIRRLQDASRIKPLTQSLLTTSPASLSVDTPELLRVISELQSVLKRVGGEVNGAALDPSQTQDRLIELEKFLISEDYEGFRAGIRVLEPTLVLASEKSQKQLLDSEEKRDRWIMEALLGLLILCWLLVLSTISLIYRRVLIPLEMLREHCRELSRGSICSQISYNASDEIGAICNFLDRGTLALCDTMVAVHGSVEILRDTATELEQLSASLGENSGKTVEASLDVKDASSDVKNFLRQISETIDIVEQSLGDTTKRMSNIIQIGEDSVSATRDTTATIHQLEERSREIGSIVKTINNIAGQTNMLALNATIEAASAGEAGRSFTVVADEIKALAHQTAAATKDIDAQIAAIQRDVRTVAASVGRVTGFVDEITELQMGISASMEQQTFATTEIRFSLNNASDRSDEIMAQAETVANRASETESIVHSAEESSHELLFASRRLANSIAAFSGRSGESEEAGWPGECEVCEFSTNPRIDSSVPPGRRIA